MKESKFEKSIFSNRALCERKGVHMKRLIDKLHKEQMLSKAEFMELIGNINPETSEYLFQKSRQVATENFGNKIYIRGLIEFTNFCKNDCFYCGIRKSNSNANRYRLSEEEILSCCESGYKLGFRTFVLQGGEDGYFTDDKMESIVRKIRARFEDCAITLSIGEKSYEAYLRLFNAGANRFLLRHETANDEHYSKLHPKSLTLENRKRCLFDLKKIGYQVGSGFMVGSPYQTNENLVEDLFFLKELQPEMVGIGPFIPHKDTDFRDKIGGSLELSLFMLGLIRLMLPHSLIPSTTALGTINSDGREKGILVGANVIMPNLSPLSYRKSYALYDNKICTGEEAAESVMLLQKKVNKIGYELVVDRGDYSESNNITGVVVE